MMKTLKPTEILDSFIRAESEQNLDQSQQVHSVDHGLDPDSCI